MANIHEGGSVQTTVATKTKTQVGLTTNLMVSLAMLAATGGFVAAVAPVTAPVVSKILPKSTLEVNPPQFGGLVSIQPASVSPQSRSAYFNWLAGADVNGNGQISPLTPLKYELYEGLSHYNENFNQPVWSTTAIPYWATRAMRYLISRPPSAGTFYILRARDPQGNQEQNVVEVSVPTSTYRVSVTSTKGGVVMSTPAGISCPTVCSGAYVAGTSVKLTATAGKGYVFSGWGGACSGTTTSCTMIMSASKSVSASFRVVNINPKLPVVY